MEEKYILITPQQVFLPYLAKAPSEADLWTGNVPNAWGNRASGNDFVDLFAGLLRKHGKRTLAFYAKKMGVAPRDLNTTLRTLTGMTVVQWMAHFVLMAANEIMATGQTPSQFFHKLGFNDVIDFSNYYTYHKGARPTHVAGLRWQRKKG